MTVRSGGDGRQVPPRRSAWLAAAASPSDEAWVRRTFAQLRSCDLDGIRLPWPAGEQ